jgi:hypothetical protein
MAHREIKSRLRTLQACRMPGIQVPDGPDATFNLTITLQKVRKLYRADDQYGSTQCLQIDQSTFVREAGTLYRFDRCIGWRSIGRMVAIGD